MENLELVKSISQLISNDFHFEIEFQTEDKESPLSELENWLADQIKILLDQDFSYLLNVMYRLDIKEERFRAILNLTPVVDLPKALAKEIIAREKKKVLTRIAYSSKQ